MKQQIHICKYFRCEKCTIGYHHVLHYPESLLNSTGHEGEWECIQCGSVTPINPTDIGRFVELKKVLYKILNLDD